MEDLPKIFNGGHSTSLVLNDKRTHIGEMVKLFNFHGKVLS
jgi:hypothetical protein